MYTIKVNNEQADIAISLTAEDIEKIASNMDVQLTDAQTQDVLTVFCSNILSDPDSIICTATVENIIEKVVKN
jgi:hypothetical protein